FANTWAGSCHQKYRSWTQRDILNCGRATLCHRFPASVQARWTSGRAAIDNAGPPMPAAPAFSVVLPVFNEAESIGELLNGIDGVMDRLGHSYEVVAVDDGSADGSLETLKQLASRDRRIRIYSFRRNLGKSPALTCGFQHAAGQYVFT